MSFYVGLKIYKCIIVTNTWSSFHCHYLCCQRINRAHLIMPRSEILISVCHVYERKVNILQFWIEHFSINNDRSEIQIPMNLKQLIWCLESYLQRERGIPPSVCIILTLWPLRSWTMTSTNLILMPTLVCNMLLILQYSYYVKFQIMIYTVI